MRYIVRFFHGIGFLGFVLFAALNLAAQESDQNQPPAPVGVEIPPKGPVANALIYHVEGEDFALTLGGEQTIYTAEEVRRNEIELERSGTIHTGAGTFLEIQLIPSGTVIKLAENTSLIYNGIDDNGKFVDLGLLYGRIRVVTGVSCSLVIRGGGVSAKVSEGDFGADYVLEPGSLNSTPKPLFRLHTFRGSAEVFPYGKGATAYFGGAQNLTTEKGESLSLDITSSYTFAERKPMDRAIIAYWDLHNFTGSSPILMPNTAIAAVQNVAPAETAGRASVTETAPVPPPVTETVVRYIPDESPQTDFQPYVRGSNRTKNLMLSVGLGLIAASAAVQGVAHYSPDSFPNDTARKVHNGMYGALGLGVYLTLMGIIYNPSSITR